MPGPYPTSHEGSNEPFLPEKTSPRHYAAATRIKDVVQFSSITNKEYEKYQQYQTDKLHGRILTPDGLRLICASLDNDPEKIGIHMLEMLAKFRNEGIVE